jgi:hypothetical protein
MKNYLAIIGVVLIIFALLPSQDSAEGSWWDRGVKILKDLSEDSEEQIEKEPSNAEIGEAFKQALRIGTDNVVRKLGAIDGFNADPSIHIPLPEELNTIKTMLSKIGMSQLVDDLELKLNRAAESATPKAKNLFLQAITDMTFDDVKNIYKGPDNSATEYFQNRMSSPLKKEMQPIVENTLSQVGAIQAYDKVIGQYKTLPFVPDVKANLTEHVIQKGMKGIFYYIAKEEASIRKNPAKQTTALLKKVFGVK